MNKHRGLVLAFILFLTILSYSSVSSAAPQIVGTKCVKAGSFRTAKNVKHQCKYSAKGLRWVMQSPKSAPTTTTTTTTTIALRPYQVVYQDVLKWAESSRPAASKSKFTVEFSPNFDVEKAKRFTEALIWAFLPWEWQTLGEGVRVVVVDEFGEEFWESRKPSGSHNCGGRGEPNFFSANLRPNGFTGFGCWSPGGQKVLIWVIGSMINNFYGYQTIIHHEVTHLAQLATYSKEGDFPCFLSEGEASFFDDLLGEGRDAQERSRQRDLGIARVISAKYSLTNNEEWIKHITLREPRNTSFCAVDSYNYAIGSLHVEKLLIDFGLAKLRLFNLLLANKVWREAFAQSFETTPTDWYRQSFVPYIRDACAC
jgi:hypothetical protein